MISSCYALIFLGIVGDFVFGSFPFFGGKGLVLIFPFFDWTTFVGGGGATGLVGGGRGLVGFATGAVGGATGLVGFATGAVGFATGAVGGATGAVGGATGAVGGATGAVGGATGAVGGVTGAVGAVGDGPLTLELGMQNEPPCRFQAVTIGRL